MKVSADIKQDLARRVSRYWLRSAEALLGAGKSPVKLSQQHRMLVMEQAEAEGRHLTLSAVKEIARDAVADAKFQLIHTNEFPRVRAWAIRSIMK
jgi:hypothetical protein